MSSETRIFLATQRCETEASSDITFAFSMKVVR